MSKASRRFNDLTRDRRPLVLAVVTAVEAGVAVVARNEANLESQSKLEMATSCAVDVLNTTLHHKSRSRSEKCACLQPNPLPLEA